MPILPIADTNTNLCSFILSYCGDPPNMCLLDACVLYNHANILNENTPNMCLLDACELYNHANILNENQLNFDEHL